MVSWFCKIILAYNEVSSLLDVLHLGLDEDDGLIQ